MSLDFQQVREQVIRLGEGAPARQQELQKVRELAGALLESNADNLEALRRKVHEVARHYDPSLRCALPVAESLTASYPTPPLEGKVTIIAADGSQIAPDRHAEVEYGLINVGAICMRQGHPDPPATTITSRLLYDEDLYTRAGTITDARLALMRDLNERAILAELAKAAEPPVVTFTDGPMELWGARDGGAEATEFQKSLNEYLEALERLRTIGVATAGYVDKPGANLVVRLLEVSMLAQSQLADIREWQPLRGVTDRYLFMSILDPGERSAVFAVQSQSAPSYQGPLALHFFYLNVGRTNRSALARVEIPAWVAESPALLDLLHAVLVDQCRTMGGRSFPYLLHRAHETAVVTMPEKDQVTRMIAQELYSRGVPVDGRSGKSSAKEMEGRTRYKT